MTDQQINKALAELCEVEFYTNDQGVWIAGGRWSPLSDANHTEIVIKALVADGWDFDRLSHHDGNNMAKFSKYRGYLEKGLAYTHKDPNWKRAACIAALKAKAKGKWEEE